MPTGEQGTEVVMRIDGGSRGNPGPAAYAVVAEDAAGSPLASFSKFLGQTTNNVAEYEALLAALGYALRHRHLRLKIFSDSELLVRQINGSYKVKNADLKTLHQRAQQMMARLEAFSIQHVPREQNRRADRLVNEALDSADAGEGLRPAPTGPRAAPLATLHARATYQRGVLKPDRPLPLGATFFSGI